MEAEEERKLCLETHLKYATFCAIMEKCEHWAKCQESFDRAVNLQELKKWEKTQRR